MYSCKPTRTVCWMVMRAAAQGMQQLLTCAALLLEAQGICSGLGLLF